MASTGPVSRPSSRTVSVVKRRPTWRPMTANAAWLSRPGDGEVLGDPAEHDDAREHHRPEEHAGGDLRARRQQVAPAAASAMASAQSPGSPSVRRRGTAARAPP